MKYTLLLIVTLITASLLPSCSSTPDPTLSSIAKIGLAYVSASGKVSPTNQVYVDLAYEVATTGKLDKARLVSLAQAKLSEKLSPAEAAQITDLIESLRTGKLDKQAVVSLGKTALSTYAASHGIPPEQSAAVIALVELLAGSTNEPALSTVAAPPAA